MLRLFTSRLAVSLPMVVIVVIVSFLLAHLSPTDPAHFILGEERSSPEEVARINAALGFDKPLLERFADWSWNAVHGDLGTSLFSSASVTELIGQRLWATLSLALVGAVLGVMLGVALGAFAAVRAGSLFDRCVLVVTSAGLAVPSFVVGLVVAYLFAVRWGWLPASGYSPVRSGLGTWFKSLILPGSALAIPTAATVARHMRSSLLEVLDKDYIRAARARGLTGRQLIVRHGIRNAAVPVVTVAGLQLVWMLGGVVIIEEIFGIPGIGQLTISSALRKDIPVLQGVVLLSAAVVVVVNLVVDLAYAALDPRVRASS